ncbi:ATPase [Peribacillus sp. FSL R5-0717]|uniref:ATPase n=1 Tax=Peribacillus sp. FSL R5-0717 TaxID=2975308 RepID=UPI0030FCE385
MALTTGPIENVGNQPGDADDVRVKILNRASGPISGLIRAVRLNGTRILIEEQSYNVPVNSSAIRTLNLDGAFEYEVVIIPNQNGGIFTVYGRSGGTIIDAQRVLNSELTTSL